MGRRSARHTLQVTLDELRASAERAHRPSRGSADVTVYDSHPYLIRSWSLLAAVSLAFLSACGSAPTLPGACQPVAPRILPSGAPPGPHRVEEIDGTWQVTWSLGAEQVTQAAGMMGNGQAPARLDPEAPPNAVVRGQPASVIPIGDPPVSQIAIEWSVGECWYTVWVGPGLTLDEAKEYAERY